MIPKVTPFLFGFIMLLSGRLFASTFVVDNAGSTDDGQVYTASDGTNTLIKCIRLSQQNAGADIIQFSISGTITHTIDPGAITQQLTIDGTTAPGYTLGNPSVMIDLGGGNFPGFNLNTGSDNSVIQGIAVVNSAQAGLYINNAGNITVDNCYVGIQTDGSTAGGNLVGIQFINSSGNTVQNTVVSNSTTDGISFSSATNNTVNNCTIGLNAAGTSDEGNGESGIRFMNNANNNTITNNVISGNDA